MGAPECRRCYGCDIRYPVSVAECLACGEPTDWVKGVAPDASWEEDAEVRRLTLPTATEAGLRKYRHRVLVALGFSGAMLEVLVEQHTDLHLAEKIVKAGCPLDVAARILI